MGWHWGGTHTRKWHGPPQGILGMGFGVKRTDGIVAAQECVRVYVRKKLSKYARHRRATAQPPGLEPILSKRAPASAKTAAPLG
jgi:hypothetical protein